MQYTQHTQYTKPGLNATRPHPKKFLRGTFRLAILPLLALVMGCGSDIIPHGNSLDASLLDRLEVGSTRRVEVEALFGKPSVNGAFDSGTIYYVAQVMKQAPAGRKSTISRDVIAFHFDADDVLTGYDRLTAEDGKNVAHLEEATPTPGQKFGVFDQIFRNIRNVNAQGGQQ
ncbi:MAG: outer membrane protein assembly factor BamE [Proteobacteria bacterium]|nr:outer membrane protein assembly factor BamE [Pseudomonadota bacterium]